MITKEKFTELIREYYKQRNRIDLLNELLPGCYGASVIDFGWKMFDEVENAFFTEEGIEWIDYYLYENPNKCYYVDDKRVSLESIDDLWETVKPYRK